MVANIPCPTYLELVGASTLMLGFLLIKGLRGFPGNKTDPEGNTDTGLAVALSKYPGLIGDLKRRPVHVFVHTHSTLSSAPSPQV